MSLQPGQDVIHHFLMLDIIVGFVQAARIDMQGFIGRAGLLVKMARSVHQGGPIELSMQQEHREDDL